jgi:hypothetical protein
MPPSRSWMSAGCTMAWSSKPSISTRICRFLPLIFLPHTDQCRLPLFRALHTLAVGDCGGGAGITFCRLRYGPAYAYGSTYSYPRYAPGYYGGYFPAVA